MKNRDEKIKSDLCLSCQECCRKIRVPVGTFLTQHSRDFYKARGIDIISYKGLLWLVLPHICAQLTPAGCKIYEDRPVPCRVYNGRDDPIVNCKWHELEEE